MEKVPPFVAHLTQPFGSSLSAPAPRTSNAGYKLRNAPGMPPAPQPVIKFASITQRQRRHPFSSPSEFLPQSGLFLRVVGTHSAAFTQCQFSTSLARIFFLCRPQSPSLKRHIWPVTPRSIENASFTLLEHLLHQRIDPLDPLLHRKRQLHIVGTANRTARGLPLA